MGDRAEVKIVGRYDDGAVHLYTHWGGSEIEGTVRSALERGRGRWGDSNYLARIILCEMIPEDMWKETTGYGISTTEMGDTHTMIVVDDDARTVEVKLRDYEGDFPTSGDRPWLSGAVMPYETFIREQIVETATRLRHQVVQRPVTRC